jgi:hypothetical protein
VDFAADNDFVTVLTTDGEVWDAFLGDGLDMLNADKCVPPPLQPRMCPKSEGREMPTPRVVQVLAEPYGGEEEYDYVGGCVTDDGRVHVWNRTGRVGKNIAFRPGQAIVGWTKDTMGSSEALPGIRVVALRNSCVVALTHDGRVWYARLRVWNNYNPVLNSKPFGPWKEVSRPRAC